MFHPLLLNGPVNELHEAEVEDITKEFIQKASIKTKGATGPLEFDADAWWRIIGSKVFGDNSLGVRKSFARMTKKLYLQQLQSCKTLQPAYQSVP